MDSPFFLFVFVIAVGVGAQWLASRLQLPVIILLLTAGLLAGPGTGIVHPEQLLGDLLDPFISLAVAVVLFEGGLSLNFKEARHVGKTLGRLIVSGLVLGFGLTTVVGHYVCGLTLGTASVLGAILVVTGPTVILPLLRGARIASRPATLLKWEGIVNDPLGALLALFVLKVAERGDEAGAVPAFIESALRFAGTTMIAGLLGGGMGYLLHRSLDRGWVEEHIKSPVIFASVLILFFVSDQFVGHESGLMAVTVMGVVMANVENAHVEDVRRFKEQLGALLVSVLFLLLSARLQWDDLHSLIGWPLVLIGMVVFVVRPAVGMVATIGSGLSMRERVLLSWIAPRGVVAAAVAGAFGPVLVASGYPDGRLLEPIIFGVIITTVLLHGLSLGPLARRLGLGHVDGNGILIVGASLWAINLAQRLASAGAKVLVADARYRRVSRARQEGLEVHYYDVLGEDVGIEMPMEQVSWVFAATDDDAYNALVCLRFGPELGRERVVQLTPAPGEGSRDISAHLMGRNPWGGQATYHSIASRFWRGAAFKVTSINANFPFQQLRENNPEALVMFSAYQGRLRLLSETDTPPTGSQVIFLT